MKYILVIGANGQLGNELQSISTRLPDWNWIFTDISDKNSRLDITNPIDVQEQFEKYKFKICINAAAYTAVDQAESNFEQAKAINTNAIKWLVEECNKHQTLFFHISTDFVFDGHSSKPYIENHQTNPLNVYGKTKRAGEIIALQNPRTFVIRTSWLYSSFGHNFAKTMLKIAQEKEQLNIVYDQIGTPTYALDLAECITTIIEKVTHQVNFQDYGIYHFSNEGVASWYDFAQAIFEYYHIPIKITPIPSSNYPTPAQRPHFSVMSKEKIKKTFHLNIPHWRESLKVMLAKIQ